MNSGQVKSNLEEKLFILALKLKEVKLTKKQIAQTQEKHEGTEQNNWLERVKLSKIDVKFTVLLCSQSKIETSN